MLVVAHPDDEVIGAGARLACLSDVTVVQVTDGAPIDPSHARAAGCADRGEYARRRAAEREAALALARMKREQVHELGFVDLETTTRIVPLARELERVLGRLGAEIVLTHPYEGGHPDHDAAALAVRAACTLLRARGERAPAVLEFTSYHAQPGRGLVAHEFLPNGGSFRTVVLSADERALKQRMYACYASQQRVLANFGAEVERFRLAPRYDFTRAPHEGRLHYESCDWAMAPELWRQRARDALAELGLGRDARPSHGAAGEAGDSLDLSSAAEDEGFGG